MGIVLLLIWLSRLGSHPTQKSTKHLSSENIALYNVCLFSQSVAVHWSVQKQCYASFLEHYFSISIKQLDLPSTHWLCSHNHSVLVVGKSMRIAAKKSSYVSGTGECNWPQYTIQKQKEFFVKDRKDKGNWMKLELDSLQLRTQQFPRFKN